MPIETARSSRAMLHLAAASVAVLLWGGSFAVTRSAVMDIPPMTLALARFVISFLLLAPLSRGTHGKIRLAPSDRWAALGLGVFGVTLYHAFENLGLSHASASSGSLIIATVPLATAIAGSAAARSLPDRFVTAGLFVGFAGVALLLRDTGVAPGSVLGSAFMGGAVLCWVGYTGLLQRLSGRYPDIWLASVVAGIGAVGLAPFAAAEYVRGAVSLPSASGWASLLYLGGLCSALAYVLWNGAVRVLGAVATNSLIYAMPLIGVLSGVLFLGEPLSPQVLAGAALIVGGVALASGASLRAPPAFGTR